MGKNVILCLVGLGLLDLIRPMDLVVQRLVHERMLSRSRDALSYRLLFLSLFLLSFLYSSPWSWRGDLSLLIPCWLKQTVTNDE